MSHSPGFLFTTCQSGAEGALKEELARVWPSFRFAYSRPGFLTFKLPAGPAPPDNFDLQSVFARSYGFSLGKADAATADERARQVQELLGPLPIDALHVWSRDGLPAGGTEDEPESLFYSPAISETRKALYRAGLNAGPSLSVPPPVDSTTPAFRSPLSALDCPSAAGVDDAQKTDDAQKQGADAPRSPGGVRARVGDLVGDVILVDESLWWVGYHRARTSVSTWPGGLFNQPLPADAVSRVYLKMLEAVRWAEFSIGRGQTVVEIGCAPGGASQALLDLGAKVVGVDPAEMHPLVLGHPRFRHIRRRSKEVRRSEFVGVDWLTCDINLPPNYTLDTVEAAVTYPGVKLQGMLLTLKFLDWSMAARTPEYLDRVRSWGFRHVAARQLHHNRREICVAASNRGKIP